MTSSFRRSTLTVSCFVLILTPVDAAQLCGQISARGVGPFRLCGMLAFVLFHPTRAL